MNVLSFYGTPSICTFVELNKTNFILSAIFILRQHYLTGSVLTIPSRYCFIIA
jgi:hypothetical protein